MEVQQKHHMTLNVITQILKSGSSQECDPKNGQL